MEGWQGAVILGRARRQASAEDQLTPQYSAMIRLTLRGSARRLTKRGPRLKRLKALNPDVPAEKLMPVAAGQIIA